MIDSPLCFVLMPFGTKKDPSGGPDIDFDTVYESAIRPALETAGMEPIRADEERTGGVIQKPMFERLVLCDYTVADLTTGNANVFYELGVRHASRPHTTLALYESRQKPPFDLNFLRCLSYQIAELNKLKEGLAKRMTDLRQVAQQDAAADSPLFQLLTGYGAPDIARLKTDVFRDRVRYESEVKRSLSRAREACSPAAVADVEKQLGHFDAVEAGVLVDLFLSYRAVKNFDAMADLYRRLPVTLQRTPLMQEQLGFALNRLGRRREALEVLEGVVADRGPSSETNGLIGRVYKDQWTQARKDGLTDLASGYLDRAIDAYTAGFEADWRDAYPGVNAVTLLDIRGDDASQLRKMELLPVVRFAVRQRLKSSKPDYWDYATLLELAVLEGDAHAAKQQLSAALSAVREIWEPETTANNLKLIRDNRLSRGVDQPWLSEIIAPLSEASKPRP